MGKKTKIDWCNSTWNPVTGCLHGCAYCYARRIAERFGGHPGNRKGKVGPQRAWVEHIAQTCKASGIPLFMKDSLRELMGDDFRQEFPWEDE